MGQKTILDLKTLPKSDLTDSDLLLIADISEKETKNIEVSEYRDYTISKLDVLITGSLTGSFYGKLSGTSLTSSCSTKSELSSTSSFLIFDGNLNGSSSYSVTSSNTIHSISSSNVVSSSCSLTSSYSNLTSFAFSTSSTKAINSFYSPVSEKSNFSSTASFINYYGQNNGTVISSSFSEISNTSELSSDILDAGSSIVQHALASQESNQTLYSESAVTASVSSFSTNAESALVRLFSSLEFRVNTDVANKKINVTPISWKNIKNIAVGNIGNLYTDFYITYKNRPPFPSNYLDLATVMDTVVVGSIQFNSNNLIKNVRSSKNNPKPIPVFSSYVFPCGVDGYVIRFVNPTLYGERRRSASILQDIVGFFGATGHKRQTSVSNDYGALYWNTQLDGVIISAQSFCNTVNFLEVGPPFDTISQFRYENNLRYKASLQSLQRENTLQGFPATSNILINIFNWAPAGGEAVTDTPQFNVVRSIAHNSGSFYNLLLLENDTIKTKDGKTLFTGRQIGLVNGKTFYFNSLHYPKIGSNIIDSVNDVNYIYYNTSSNQYICVGSSKILYSNANSINEYTGSSIYGTNLYNTTLHSLLPIWNYYNTGLNKCTKISPINNNRYLLITDDEQSLKLPGASSGNLPVYIIPDITNQSTPLIQCTDVAGTFTRTKRKIGNLSTSATLPENQNDYVFDARDLTIDKTTFKNILVLDDKRAIVGGINGVIAYSNNIDSSSPKWIRVDALAMEQPDTSTLISQTTEYVTEINGITVAYPGSVETIMICGKDSSKRSCMISCVVPKSPDDVIIPNWKWNPVPGSYFTSTLDTDSNGNLLPSQIGSSSYQAIYRDINNTIVAGFSTFPSSSYYKYGLDDLYPYKAGSYDTSSIVNDIGKIDTKSYLFGGKNILDYYSIISS